MAQERSPQEDASMLHAVHYPRDLIVDRVRFTPADHTQIAQCRGAHNRLGFAYQLGFLRLTGRFPAQQPLELLNDLLVFVAQEVALDPALIQDYAQRRQTVSEHQQLLALYLGFRPFGPAERDALGHFVRDEALRLESTPALVAQAEAFLRDHHILVPASSTLQRVVGEQRALARQQLYVRLLACLPSSMPADLDALVQVEETPYSPLHALKAPPGLPSPRALLRLIAKLDQIQATQVLALDLTWLNPNLQKALAQHVWQASAHRLRGLPVPQRYTVLVCFLTQIYRDTLDQLVDMYSKVVTATYRRAQHDLDTAVKQHRPMFRDTLQSFQTIGQMLFDDMVASDAIRTMVFEQIPPERLQRQLQDAHQWLTGDTTDVFPLVMKRYSYFRQFAPSLLAHLPVALEATGSPALLEAVEILRDLNTTGHRTLPEDLPLGCVPKRLRPFVGSKDTRNRRAYECAVLTALRDEIKRGNVWIPGSKRFGKLDDFFLPEVAWATTRQEFFRKAGLPADPRAAGTHLTTRLNTAYDQFLTALPANAYVTVEADGWRLSTDPAEVLSPTEEAGVTGLRAWLRDKVPTIRLPDLLLTVDHDLDWTRHFLPLGQRATRTADDVCQVVATIMAYGCNLGPETMARLTADVTYADIQQIADWYLHEEALRAALADIVNAIAALDTTQVWGDGRASSSDGQRFLFPRRVLRRTYSHRLGDYALEFYTFIANNYAPFYTVPIECTERDAPYVLDGLLYHESDLDPEEHYTDTHGYVELNFAAFPMFGKRFCPRIRGLHRQWIYRIEPDKDYGPLTPLLRHSKRALHLDWITAHWDRMGQFFASFAAGHTTASIALKRLLACGPRNHFYRAVRELGRLYKTIFILDYLTDPALRRRVRRGLLQGEQLHALARHVHYGKRGHADGRDFQQQMSRASCLVLILAAIIYWQILEIDRVLRHWDPAEDGIDPALLIHMSPIGWDNLILYGEYALDRSLVARYPRHGRELSVEN
jgi:TnpA family transposase